ncbi:hypothetical protein BGV40_00020 [Methanosarcina sp. Ant1]|nr:hypothetical protein BGV40_00020 [Methanosarcina sp. Ant1]
MISIVCVYNDQYVLEKYLLSSLNTQTVEYEKILIDNRNGNFKSASESLNYGGMRATGKYIMFVHQDVRLCSNEWLDNTENILDSLPNVGISGVAGMSETGKSNRERQRNIIIEHESPITVWGNPIQKPEIVQTLDECLIIIPQNIFRQHAFDTETCEGWHFYSVDYCLSIKQRGFDVYVIPSKVHHQSLGFYLKFSFKISSFKYFAEYYNNLNKVLKKHNKSYSHIYTTNGDYYSGSNVYLQDFKRLVPKLFSRLIRNIQKG